MNILIIEPYFTGSHKTWAEGYKNYSKCDIDILSLSGHYWKWRMHGGAVTLAKKYFDKKFSPDLIIASDMLDLTTFLALTRAETYKTPVVLYMHENQLTYPWSEKDRDVKAGRDNHYGFINYSTAMAADKIMFNSPFHLESFISALKPFLKGFPDNNELDTIELIKGKSSVLDLGLSLAKFDEFEPAEGNENDVPHILWNHRWEYDKNPDSFFEALYHLHEKSMEFKVIILGENFAQSPGEFQTAKERLGDKIVQFGYAEDFKAYARLLWKADIIPITSNQDFFGGSVVEAIYCNTIPLLPDRLAYPMHIANKYHTDYLYSSQEELLEKLEQMLSEFRSLRNPQLKKNVSKYDWKNIAPLYDAQFEELLLSK